MSNHFAVVISGFGGQGILFAGELLALSAMAAGKETTWFPSYGPEMRGGTAHCTVVVADEEIGSPLVQCPRAAMVMNLPSLDTYELLIKPGGFLIADSSMVDHRARRADITAVFLPATTIAEELGAKRIANLVMLGALLQASMILPLSAVEQALADALPAKRRDLLPLNILALHRGAEAAKAAAAHP